MNNPKFSGSKVEEEPNGFINEVYKTLAIIGLVTRENAELAVYQFKDVAQIWIEKQKDSRLVEVGPIEWDTFKFDFLYRLLPRQLREARLQEFINLKKGNWGINVYVLKFILLSMYATSFVASP